MSTAKLLFYAIVIFLAAIGGIMLFGLIVNIAQYLFWLGAILLAGYIVVKVLKKKPEPAQLKTGSENLELEDALRRLEEIKRAQLPK